MSEITRVSALSSQAQGYNTNSIKNTEEINIFIDPNIKDEVEKLRLEFGNDKILEVLAGLGGKKNQIGVSDLLKLNQIDGKLGEFSKDDINIFKNAANMYLANKDKIKSFDPVLKFTREYFDIENGDLDDNLFLEPSKELENAFKQAQLREDNYELTIKLDDFNFSNPNDFSITIFNKNNKINEITYRTKNYADGTVLGLVNTRIENQMDLLYYKKGITGTGKMGDLVDFNGHEYKYNVDKDAFYDMESPSMELHSYVPSEDKMVPFGTCYTDVAKRLYGENFFASDIDKAYSEKNATGIKNGRALTDEDIQKIINDPTSTIGQIIRFNNENKNNTDLNTVIDMELMNKKLIETLKAGKLVLSDEPGSYGTTTPLSKTDPVQKISIQYVKNYSKDQNDTELFNTLYHELIHTQQPEATSYYKMEEQAFTGADRADKVINGTINDEIKNNIAEQIKYILNYGYKLRKN